VVKYEFVEGGRVTLIQALLAEVDREAARTTRLLEQVPDGKGEWKPHEKSMGFGYLANLVATMPSWIAMMIDQDSLDLNPPGGSGYSVSPHQSSADLLAAHQKAVADARAALQKTNEAHLFTIWKLLVAGNTVAQGTRYEMIRDSINHQAHHRGQATVYLRLLGSKVPAIYGPSADDKRF
jgi:uncharacterized damage-inducible protein DinB